MIRPHSVRLARGIGVLWGAGSLLAAAVATPVASAAPGAGPGPAEGPGIPSTFLRTWTLSEAGESPHAVSELAPRFDSRAPAVRGGRWDQQIGGDLSAAPSSLGHNRSAILTSLLLPGLAQYRMGEKERGLAFMTLEAALWTSFVAFRIQGENREDSYIEMAELFAGIAPDAPRNEDFYTSVANWPSSDLYNEIVVRRLARTQAGDDIEARELYYEENRIQGNETWAWTSEVARNDYRAKRTEAQRSFKRSSNMIGVAVANRVVAMIDAVLLSNRLHGSAYGLEVTQSRDGSDLVARIGLRRRLP